MVFGVGVFSHHSEKQLDLVQLVVSSIINTQIHGDGLPWREAFLAHLHGGGALAGGKQEGRQLEGVRHEHRSLQVKLATDVLHEDVDIKNSNNK